MDSARQAGEVEIWIWMVRRDFSTTLLVMNVRSILHRTSAGLRYQAVLRHQLTWLWVVCSTALPTATNATIVALTAQCCKLFFGGAWTSLIQYSALLY